MRPFVGSSPTPDISWFRGGIGIRACLRREMMRVRIPPKPPFNGVQADGLRPRSARKPSLGASRGGAPFIGGTFNGEQQAVNLPSYSQQVRFLHRRPFDILAQGVEPGFEPAKVGVRVLPRVPFPRAQAAHWPTPGRRRPLPWIALLQASPKSKAGSGEPRIQPHIFVQSFGPNGQLVICKIPKCRYRILPLAPFRAERRRLSAPR